MNSNRYAQMRLFSNCMCAVLIITGLAFRAGAQEPLPVIAGPILGFTQDPAGAAVQPILGVAGASVLGPQVQLGADVRNAILSPKQDYAVAVRGDNAEAVVIQLNCDGVTVNSLDKARAGVDL